MWAPTQPAVMPRVVAGLVMVAWVVGTGCGRFSFTSHDRADGALGDSANVGDGSGSAQDDASVDGGPSVACTSAAVCEGFEATTFPAIWTADPGVTLDTTRAHRGTRSVHVHANAFAANTNSYQTLQESATITSNINPFWVRGWFWLSALPATGNGMELMTAEKPGSMGDYVFVFPDSTHIYTQYGNASWTQNTTVPTGQWFCLVWKVVRDTGTAGSLDLFGDVGTLNLPNVKTDSTTNTMSLLTIGIGFAGPNVPTAQPALDLWIDDVIVSGSTLTCAD